MKIRAGIVLCVAFSVAIPGIAGVIYSNGAASGCCYALFIDGPGGSPGQSVSDGFVAAETGTAFSLDFGEQLIVGNTPTKVTWKLGTSPFASDISSGAAPPLTFTYVGNVLGALDVYNVHVPGLSGNLVSGNTYYLTLENADTSAGDHYAAWDSLNGAVASCWVEQGGVSPHACITGGSQAFTIFDSSVAEPGSMMLLSGGLLALATSLVRRARRG